MKAVLHRIPYLGLAALIMSGGLFFAVQAQTQAPDKSPGQAKPATSTPADSAAAKGTASSKKPAPARDDAVTIEDDPTVAPDPAQSADNNVSYPVDI